ncbi:MAG TPA: DinB family protein [Anditalea sp.]|nr:DinB family protein [Anditalea sp.]
MESFFKELFEYSHHFNQKLMDTMLTHPEPTSDRSLQLLNHLVNAHHIWNNRIMEMPPKTGVWDLHLFEDIKKSDSENLGMSISIVDQIEMDKMIMYTNSQGVKFTNSVRDILFHIINHSTHHRAQISSDLKINGVPPIPMDYIFFKR